MVIMHLVTTRSYNICKTKMENMKVREKLRNIMKQFLSCVQIKCFQWENIFQDLTCDLQDTLLNKTVNSELVLKYPIQTSYQKMFLKYLIEKLEMQETEISDNVYSAYGRLVSLPVTNELYFKHYITKSETIVSLKENVNLISDGTTGLRTWQASLALSEWILENDGYFKNKVILELGSGIGFTGLIIAMETSPSCIYFTDCHRSVLETLCENVALNIENVSVHCTLVEPDTSNSLKIIRDRVMYNRMINTNKQVVVLNLPWQDVDEEKCLNLGTINAVVAADVVYDSALFKPLIEAITSLALFCSVEEFIFSCTERNSQTIETFVKEISEASFTIEELCVPNQKNFIWPTDTPIKIFKFKLNISGKRNCMAFEK